MIVKKDNVELIIKDDDFPRYEEKGFRALGNDGKETDPEPTKNLKDMTVAELKELAQEQGIDGVSGLNKTELLKVLGG